MRRYFQLVRDFHHDAFFPCDWLTASNLAAQELLSETLNASLFDGRAPRNLKLWERVLLALGF